MTGLSGKIGRRNVFWGICATLWMRCLRGRAQPVSGDGERPWDQITQLANDFVVRESPPSVFPFQRASAEAMNSSPRKVFIHYFPFFTLSFENKTADQDHWAQFLSPTGENGKWAAAGGFTRERPLSPKPWDGPFWRELNSAVDVLRAQLIGADGFGVDLTQLEPADKLSQAHVLRDTIAAVAPKFRLLIEPDTDILKAASPTDMAKIIVSFGQGSSSFRLADGRLLIVPFAPNAKPVAYWKETLQKVADAGEKVAFLPDLVGLDGAVGQFAPISMGMSFWGPRDPATADSAGLQAAEHSASSAGSWMQPVAPQDVRPKSSIFWEAQNTRLFRDLWMQAISKHAAYVHLITWNDYSETTEIAPSSGTQFLFYDLSAFYTEWFKLGRPPTVIRDAIYYCHRTQIFSPDAHPRQGSNGFHNNGQTPVQNEIEMVAMLTSPATLEITVGPTTRRDNVGAGLQILLAPAQPGKPRFRILRDGRPVLEKVSDWTIEETAEKLNPAYFGGSTTRTFSRSL